MEMFRFILPPGMSVTEEIIFRFCGECANDPIYSLLIRAGYKDIFRSSGENVSTEQWANIHSGEWNRYNFFRWREFQQEISEEIKKLKNDRLQLKKYICGLLMPVGSYYLPRRFTQGKISVEINFILEHYPRSFISINNFIIVWKKVLSVARALDKENDISEDDYKKLLEKNYSSEMSANQFYDSSEGEAFFEHYQFPYLYAGSIAGCLLENGAPVEYMQYQKMCGIRIVPELSVQEVAFAMNWTPDFVRSYNPKTLCDLDNKGEKPPIVVKEHKESARVSFGEFPQNMPELLKRPEAVPYWEEAYRLGYIDKNFRFNHKKYKSGVLAWFAGNMYLALTGRIDLIISDKPEDELPRMEWKIMRQWEEFEHYATRFGRIKKGYQLYQHRERIRNIFISKLNGQKDGEEVKK